ncbi:ketosynthase chain-length factor [Crossiella sp. SN42]|uniref:ketosynthase chain-length factor n=1 Tax=Crossiella sp. SN42 TaxID=2944808 RepID=UPI00207CFEFE|nr:ketosynthase chain-length factor [Crossiella sp. SN42]MCO1580345.1 ketosynthase chain-length factor [Crossiella sp. SN42]
MTGRAVITGLGVVAPNGIGVEAYWAATLAGKSGIDHGVRAGVVPEFAAADHLPSRLLVQTDRWTQFGLAAAELALADAALDPATLPEYEFGVVTGSSSGGNEFGQREIAKLWTGGPEHVGVYQSIAWFYAATTGQVSIRHGARGPCGVLVSEQAAGLDALGQARRMLRTGASVLLSGGAEAPLSPYAKLCQETSGRISHTGYRPFARDADGHLPGEGGALLVLESEASARRRGARGYGVLAGYAATFDPPPGSHRPPALRRAIELAIADARLSTSDIDVVFADAAGTPGLDRREAQALAEVFGPHGVPVTAPKSMTGRLYAGGAPLDVAAALLCLRDQVIPPTTGIGEVPEGYLLDLVKDEPRPDTPRTALVLARGAGGFNSAVVLTTAGGNPCPDSP